MMYDCEKSDRPVVPAKPSNKAAVAAAEMVEERGLAKGTMSEQNTCRTQSRGSVHNAFARVRVYVIARQNPRQEPSAVTPLAGI